MTDSRRTGPHKTGPHQSGPLPIVEIQEALAAHSLDGWLLWDFRGQNGTAVAALGLADAILTRRLAYWIPTVGSPVLIGHRVEIDGLPALAGERRAYSSHRELDDALVQVLTGAARIAMEYSPGGAIPTLSRVDAGTIERVRDYGVEVVSSAELVQHFLCRLSTGQIESHRRAALGIDEAKDEAFRFIARRIADGRPALETEVQDLLMKEFARRHLTTDHAPVVAVNAHAGNPHYAPAPEVALPCGPDAVVLIDLWAKEQRPDAVYADVTWMAYGGARPPERVGALFDLVVAAREIGLATVREGIATGRRLEGWMVDRAVRDFLAGHGHGDDAFVHRTGHNIGAHAVHGDGANLDDFETHDTRPLVTGLCFSIEPGLYFGDVGFRSEIDVVLEPDRAAVYTPSQHHLLRLTN